MKSEDDIVFLNAIFNSFLIFLFSRQEGGHSKDKTFSYFWIPPSNCLCNHSLTIWFHSKLSRRQNQSNSRWLLLDMCNYTLLCSGNLYNCWWYCIYFSRSEKSDVMNIISNQQSCHRVYLLWSSKQCKSVHEVEGSRLRVE